MSIYWIDKRIDDLLTSEVNPETGEIAEGVWEEIEALNIERGELIEQLGMEYKNLVAEAAACKAEADALAKRAAQMKNRAAAILLHVSDALQGQKFSTPKVEMTWRKSMTTEVYDREAFFKWAKRHKDCLTVKDPEPNKTAIKKIIDEGGTVPGAKRVEHNNMTIK